ncbi:MAG: hypothetical protein PHX59_05485 [Sulfuricurvum sp.]|nr:hypothetical protein [Sulfuricurvum sp.]
MSNYDFNIIDIIKASYRQLKGFKVTGWILIIIMAVVTYTLYQAIVLFLPPAELNSEQMKQNMLLFGFLAIPISAPLMTGFFMTIISYTRGEKVSYKSIFKYYPIMWKLSLASLFIHTINKGVFFGINIVGNYLQIGWFVILGYLVSVCIGIIYIFTLPLIADKGLKIWDAMELSRKAIFAHFFKIIFLYLSFIIMMAISAIPLGIGMIWTVPMIFIGFYGLLYRVMFDGIEYNDEEKIIAQ